MLLCEASRAPSCSDVNSKSATLQKGECLRAYGLGSQCRPNLMHIWVRETQGGSGFWVGGYKGQVREQGSSLRATWERGGRILSQKEGSK